MAKRKSWDEKNKYIHPSRKKIIDTVFGREDNTQRVFGFEGEADKKREVGERWVDENGKEWEQKEDDPGGVIEERRKRSRRRNQRSRRSRRKSRRFSKR